MNLQHKIINHILTQNEWMKDELIQFKNKIIQLPLDCHIEGGDVILNNNHIFIGTYSGSDYSEIKTARTNSNAVDFIKEKFPEKKILSFDLIML